MASSSLPAQSDCPTFHLLGCILRFCATRDQTNGKYLLVEALVAPGAGAPPNTHPDDDETFHVLEGRFEFLVGDQTRLAGPGETVVIPNGAPHAFRNAGEAPARMMIVNAPGQVHELFYSEAGEPLAPGTTAFPPRSQPDVSRLTEIARRAGMNLLPPA